MGQAFLIASAVLFIIFGAVSLSVVRNKGAFIMNMVLLLYCIRAITVITGDIAESNLCDGKNDRINATVVSSPIAMEDTSFGYCTVKINYSAEQITSKGDKIYLYASGLQQLDIGDILETDVTYSSFENFGAEYYCDGIYLSASAQESVIPCGKADGIYGVASGVRSYIKNHIMADSDNYHILLALITGERSYVSDELYSKVIDAGVSHILVVSGMHLVLLCGILDRILRVVFAKSIFRDIVLLAFVFIMSVICGFGMSILRAAIVYLLKVICRRLGRRGRGLHFLALAVIIVMILHPYAFHSVSFQLSYSATFGILVLPDVICRKIRKACENSAVLRVAAEAFTISLCAYIATLPTCIAAFGEISLVAVAVNVLLDIPANIMLSLCVAGLALGFIPVLEKLLIMFADMLADYFLKIVNFASSLPFATLTLRNSGILSVTVLLFYFLIYIIKAKPYRILMKR